MTHFFVESHHQGGIKGGVCTDFCLYDCCKTSCFAASWRITTRSTTFNARLFSTRLSTLTSKTALTVSVRQRPPIYNSEVLSGS